MTNKLDKYELAIVIDPTQDETKRDDLIKLIEQIAKQVKGEVVKREDAGKKNLAYAVKGNTEGWYYYLTIEMPAEAVKPLDTKLKMEESIIRFLILKKD